MRRLIAATAVVGFVLLLAACGGSETPTPAPSPTVTAAEALERAAAAVDALKSFEFLLTHENGGSAIALGLEMTEAEGEIIMPEKMHAKVKAQSGGIKVNVDVIAIGDAVWITNPFDRKWMELPGGISGNDLFNPSTGVSSALRGVTSPTIVGIETIDETEAMLVQGTIDASKLQSFAPAAEAGLPVVVKAWLRTSDFVPLRLRLEGPLSVSEPANLARQLDLASFDEEFDIEQPPVQ